MDPAESHGEDESVAAHAAFVRGLARSLLKDAAAADDVAQETLLAALERAPPPGVAPRTWLAGVVRNVVRLVHRRDERRGRREAAAAVREAVPSAGQSAARLERLRRLLAAVERLDEPGRATLLLRFYDGLPPRRIARQMGVPVNTVRTRLRRALVRLREELGREFADERGGWLAAVAWLAESPALAPQCGAPRRVELAVPRAVTGAVTVGASLKLIGSIAAAVAVAAVAWTFWGRDGSGREPASDPSVVSAPAAAQTAHEAPGPTATRVETPSVVPDVASNTLEPADWRQVEGTLHLRGRLVPAAGSLDRWNSELAITPQAESGAAGQIRYETAADHEPVRVHIAADGSFAVSFPVGRGSEQEIGRLLVVGDDPRFLPFERAVHVPERGVFGSAGSIDVEVRIIVFQSGVISGRVVDARGEGVAHAVVGLFAAIDGVAADPVRGHARCDGRGRYELRAACAGPALLAAAQHAWQPSAPITDDELVAETLRPAVRSIDLPVDGDLRAPDLVLTPGVSIAGHVEMLGSGAARRAQISARPVSSGVAGLADGATVYGGPIGSVSSRDGRRMSAIGWSDSHGDFVFGGLDPGRWRVTVLSLADAVMQAAAREEMAVEVEAPCDDIELIVRGGRVTAEVTSGGKPLAGVAVWFHSARGNHRAGSDGNWLTDAAGQASIVLPPGLALTANARRDDRAEGWWAKGVAPPPGESLLLPLEVPLVASVPSFAFRVRGPGRTLLHRCGLQFQPADFDPARDGVGTLDLLAADGRFVVHDFTPGRWSFVLRPGGAFDAGDGCHAEIRTEVEVVAGRTGSGPDWKRIEGPLVEFEVTALPAGRLRVSAQRPDGERQPARLELHDAAGQPVPFELTYRQEYEGAVVSCKRGVTCLQDGPCFVNPPLPPGRYTSLIRCPNFADQTLPVEIVAGRCTELDVVLEPLAR